MRRGICLVDRVEEQDAWLSGPPSRFDKLVEDPLSGGAIGPV